MESIDKIVDKLVEEYGYIGIRVQEQEFALGAIMHNSVIWVDNEMTDEELPGICAIRCDERDADAKLAYARKTYFGQHVAILVSNRVLYGDDLHEVIMIDAEVAHIIS